VVKCHNRDDKLAAARAFRLWNKAGGEVSPGLETRRAAESALYLKPVAAPVEAAPRDMEPPDVIPQSVDAERPMTASTINRAGVIAGGTATVATVAETVNTVGYIKRGVDDIQDWIVPILLVVAVAAVGYIVWERVNQRRQGWA
jgi:lysozyme